MKRAFFKDILVLELVSGNRMHRSGRSGEDGISSMDTAIIRIMDRNG